MRPHSHDRHVSQPKVHESLYSERCYKHVLQLEPFTKHVNASKSDIKAAKSQAKIGSSPPRRYFLRCAKLRAKFPRSANFVRCVPLSFAVCAFYGVVINDEMDVEQEEPFVNLKKKLEDLRFFQPVGIESVPLASALLAELRENGRIQRD